QAKEPTLEDIVWTVAVARLIFGRMMNIQVPPNLNPGALGKLIDAGINDWGGVSPITRDYVNPEATWPHIADLAKDTARSGKTLVERLTIYPEFSLEAERWVDPALEARVRAAIDSDGFARGDAWSPGTQIRIPEFETARPKTNGVWPDQFGRVLDRAVAGGDLNEEEIVSLFTARADRFAAVCAAADDVRRQVNGNVVSYVVTRTI